MFTIFPPAFLHLNSCIWFRARDFSVLIAAMFIHLLHSTVHVSYRYCRCVVSVWLLLFLSSFFVCVAAFAALLLHPLSPFAVVGFIGAAVVAVVSLFKLNKYKPDVFEFCIIKCCSTAQCAPANEENTKTTTECYIGIAIAAQNSVCVLFWLKYIRQHIVSIYNTPNVNGHYILYCSRCFLQIMHLLNSLFCIRFVLLVL